MIKKLLISVVIFLWVIVPFIEAQDQDYTKYIIQTLSSPEFHGRGYVKNGIDSASVFVLNEFKKNGLEPLFPNYSQEFSFPVNTFPGEMSLTLDDITLKPGFEFLIDPASPGISGNYASVMINKSDIINQKALNKKLKKADGKFLIMDDQGYIDTDQKVNKMSDEIIRILKYDPRLKIKGFVELLDKKLDWNVSTVLAPRPSFSVNDQNISKKIESVTVHVENCFIRDFPVKNIAGLIKGTEKPDSFIVITAHYDHLGQMGASVYFPGANDNASGVAMMLNLASHYSQNNPEYSILFIALTGEEAGLLGSEYFVEHSPVDLKKIKFLINLDLEGNGEDGIMVVNGSVYADKFKLMTEINDNERYFSVIKSRGEACNSDHCPFYRKGIPCFFIYTMGGTQAYHDPNDTFDSLTLVKFSELTNLLIKFIASL